MTPVSCEPDLPAIRSGMVSTTIATCGLRRCGPAWLRGAVKDEWRWSRAASQRLGRRTAVAILLNCARYGLPVEPGSVADWVNAVGTLLAFVGAASAAIIAWNSYRTQLRQTALQISTLEQAERHRKVEQERMQASKVAFWVGVTSRGPGWRT